MSPTVRLQQIHHVAYAVSDIDAALPLYTRLFGMTLEVREVLPDQGVEACSLGAGRGHVELIQPLDPDNSVGRFLARRGEGMHHVAFEVPDVAAALDELRARGVDLIDQAPRRGLGGHLVAFLHPRSSGGVLTELVQSSDH
ncbi:MAG: methylmalonyl-CoA epimerase [Actinomycetota bacterium]